MNYRRIAPIALLAFSLASSSGQDAQRDTDEAFEPVRRSLDLGSLLGDGAAPRSYAPGSPGDSDLGDQLLLQPAGSYEPFSVHTGSDWRWVSNAALTDGNEIDDSYWRFGAGASYLPNLVGNLYGEIAADYDWFRYTDQSALDFDSLDARAGLINVFPDLGNLSVWTRYGYTRLASPGGAELYTEHGIEAGAFLPIPVRRDHFFYAGLISNFSLDTDPGYARRDSHSAMVGYRYTPIDRLEIGSFYRLTLFDYDAGGRSDWNHYLGASVEYLLNDLVSLRSTFSYQLNDSDLAGASYENLSAGASIGLHIKL